MKLPSQTYYSWGRVHHFEHTVHKINWLTDLDADFSKLGPAILAYGKGRSYGDCCLNSEGLLLDTSGLRRMINFDPATGRLTCESGVTLGEIIRVFLPRGWFPPVVPGTKNVTIGGAIANDIHGKNHHVAGTFGRYVHKIALSRSDQNQVVCSANENSDLFKATIGGMGLTGIIRWAEIQLKPINSALIDYENIKFHSLDEFFELTKESSEEYEYTVAWIDSTPPANQLGRGIFMRGNHADLLDQSLSHVNLNLGYRTWEIPFVPPFNLMQGWSVKALNKAYFNKQLSAFMKGRCFYEGFFFPLDKLDNWNVVFGRQGFYQYQFVVDEQGKDAIRKILKLVQNFPVGSFVTVLKAFGSLTSPGLMSFPKEGFTLTLDFPNMGEKTIKLLHQFEEILMPVGGRVYGAKDAVASPDFFWKHYNHRDDFTKHIDPKFSSNLWRRISNGR